MKKPIPSESGLALTELLYGSEREQTSNTNLHQSRTKSNSTIRRVCRSQSERIRAYERGKARLKRRNLSPQEYELEIKKLAERLAI